MNGREEAALFRYIASGGTAEQLEALARVLASGGVWALDDKVLAPIARAFESKEQYR